MLRLSTWPWVAITAGNVLALVWHHGGNTAMAVEGILIWGGLAFALRNDVHEHGWRRVAVGLCEAAAVGGVVLLAGSLLDVTAWWVYALMLVAAVFMWGIVKAFVRAWLTVRRQRKWTTG